MSKKGKIISQGKKSITMNASFTVIIEISQYLTVTSQLSMNISDIIIGVAVNAIIVIIAALVGTEFFI